jgi:hypothetical protein
MSFSPTITTLSKSTPGASFTTHKMGLAKRSALDFDTLDLRQRLRELEMDYPPQSPDEKKIGEYLEVARKKVLAVPADQFDAVYAEDVAPLLKQLDSTATPEVKKTRARLDMEFGAIDARIRVRWVLAGLVNIEGGEYDGQSIDGMTASELVEFGPPLLALEVYETLTANGQTGGTAAKNSGSPGTSGSPVDGATISTTADSAEKTTDISSGTASNIFLVK